MIYLGTDFCPNGWNTHNGEFDWKKDVFPNPKKAIDDLHALHYKVVLHVVIEGKHLTGTVDDPCTAPERSGRTPDPRVTTLEQELTELGCAGWLPKPFNVDDLLAVVAQYADC